MLQVKTNKQKCFFACFVFLCVYVLTYKRKRVQNNIKKKQKTKKAKASTTIRRIRNYPAVLFICYFFAVLRRIWNMSGNDIFFILKLYFFDSLYVSYFIYTYIRAYIMFVFVCLYLCVCLFTCLLA